MAKLNNLGSTLGSLPSRLPPTRDAEGHSKAAEPWRSWYSLAAWKRLRIKVFVRDNYTCQMSECGRAVHWPIADHIKRHGGDPVLFWDDENVQTLCKPCHDKVKQAQERQRPG